MSRPVRGDILDNFTPDEAQFVADLLKTMPGAKLTVRRSRRRPVATRKVVKAAVPVFGFFPDPAGLENWNARAHADLRELTAQDVVNAVAGVWPFTPETWRSPAQQGRHVTNRERWEKGVRRKGYVTQKVGARYSSPVDLRPDRPTPRTTPDATITGLPRKPGFIPVRRLDGRR